MKKIAKALVVAVLGNQVRRLRRKHDIKVVAVAGSIGKTTTKHVIARYLEKSAHVRYQSGNYNVSVSVPLVFFDEPMPSLFNPIAWLKLFLRNERQIRDYYVSDLVVVELGTDGPGQMKQFAKYLHADVAVLTAIAPEHMEFFKSMQAVTKEELVILEFSDKLIVSRDDVNPSLITKDHITYGLKDDSDYRLIPRGENVTIHGPGQNISLTTSLVGSHVQKSLAAAVAVADSLGIKVSDPAETLAAIEPMPGRMQLFPGLNGSQIIDDTYNNVSQVPLMAALDVLYAWPAAKRIAVLGNMNELGEYSKGAHEQVGAYCDPKKLDLVITIGPEANKYLAAAAEKAGCEVVKFDSPYKIGEYLKPKLEKNMVVLLKGSQDRVYLEEAVKPLLRDTSERPKLVRQSPVWLSKKEKQFPS